MKKILGLKIIANIALWIMLVGGLVFAIGFGTSLYIARNEVTVEVQNRIDRDMDYLSTYVDNSLQRVEDVAYTFRCNTNALSKPIYMESEESLFASIERVLNSNKHICGIAIGFNKNYSGTQGGKYGYAVYVTNVSGKNERLQLGKIHDYHVKEWYRECAKTDAPYWSHPFRETSQGKVVACFSIPVYDKDNKPIGVMAFDIDTEKFRQKCKEVAYYPGSEITIADQDFRFICHPNDTFVLKHVGEISKYSEYKASDSMVTMMRHHESGSFTLHEDTDDESLFNFRPIPRTGWMIAVECPKSEIFKGVERMKTRTTWIAIVSILFMIIVFIWLFRHLQKITLSKASIENELHIASAIQMGMIPKLYPAFPDRKDLDIYGFLKPAKSVGGDLYDYFIRDEKLFFCIGDVSGKGIPASLFMAIIRSLFRNVSLHNDDPATIADALNKGIAEGNDMNMFCTMFIGVLDLRTGRLDYCNAGHNAPVVRRIIDGKLVIDYIQPKTNIAIGIFADYPYATETATMQPGEAIFLYTDGVTEAENRNKQLFGEEEVGS